ncbi:MAG: TolC family protein [Polyangiaceae bacterium]|nr:TolC family protein [Polyangiaceae bacterium]
MTKSTTMGRRLTNGARAALGLCLLVLIAWEVGVTTARAQPADPAPTAAAGSSNAPAATAATAAPKDAAAALERELAELVGRPGGLTADTVAERVVATSQDVSVAEALRAVADAEVDGARVRYAPRLTLGAGYQRLSPIEEPVLGTLVAAPGAEPSQRLPDDALLVAAPISFPVILNQIQFRASLVVPLTDYFLRFPQAFSAAKHARSVADHDAVARRVRADSEARLAYYAWVRAELGSVAMRQARRRAAQHLRDVERALAAGLATSADVRAVEAQEAQAELIELRAADAASVAVERLATLQHLPPGTVFTIGEDVLAAPALPRAPTVEAAWAEAERLRPELRALAANREKLREQEASLRAQQLPRLDATGEALLANPNPRYFPADDVFHATWALGVQATWTVNDAPIAAASRRGISAQVRAITAQQGAVRDALRTEVVTAIRGVEQAERAISAAERAHRAATAAYGVRRDQYLAGRATSVELTDAETDLTRARIELIDALVGARIAVVRLEHALGRNVARVRGG